MNTSDPTFPDLHSLYSHVKRAIAHIIVFDDDEVISEGTGFAFTSDGAVLTAAHVIAGGFPVSPGEVDLHSRKVLVFFVQQGLQILYRPAICPFQIKGAGLEKPLQLDVAVIVPVEKPAAELDFIAASVDPPSLGDEMYFGGYSDEVEFPFSLDRYLSSNTEGLDVYQRALTTGVKARLAGPIIKRGTVGNAIVGVAENDGKAVLKQTLFYLDNQVHYGASGGPIVDRSGIARGVISKRMVTRSGDTEVPAGSTLGIGLEPLLALAAK